MKSKKQRPTQIVISYEGFCLVTKQKKYGIVIFLAGSRVALYLEDSGVRPLADDRRSVVKRANAQNERRSISKTQ